MEERKPTRFCPHCGAAVRSDIRFCVACGAAMSLPHSTGLLKGSQTPMTQKVQEPVSISSRKLVIMVFLVVILLWMIMPLFLSPHIVQTRILTVSVNRAAGVLTLGGEAFELRLQNLSPWPVTIHAARWAFGLSFSWEPGSGPRTELLIMPFQTYTYQFEIHCTVGAALCTTNIEHMSVTLQAEVTILYRTEMLEMTNL